VPVIWGSAAYSLTPSGACKFICNVGPLTVNHYVFICCVWEWFLQEDLYATICGLSYTGDVRMFFAEDKNKV
jgi:hypothetical protein